MPSFQERKKAKSAFTPPSILFTGKKRKSEENNPAAAIVKYTENRLAKEAKNERLVEAERALRINLLMLQVAKLQGEMETAGQKLPSLLKVILD